LPRWVGQSLKRREDPELLTGRGRYVADVVRPGMLHAAFVRSPFAHARIASIDVSVAAEVPGVRAVLTAADFPEGLGAQPCTHLFAGQHDTPYYALARDRVRYAGEPVAIVVADSPHLAEDGVEGVEVDWEPLGAVSSVRAALAGGAPLLYDDWRDNVAAVFEQDKGDVDGAFAAADVVVTERVHIQRQFGCSLETRGVVAEWDEFADQLTVWSSTQVLHILRDLLSDVLGLPEHRIRVIVPRIGGAFGAKFHFYPEETAVALAALATGRPVRWIEDRLESFVATVHAREQVIEATMAATRDGKITAVKADILGDMGAALHTVGYGPVWLTAVMMTNLYAIENIRARARAVVTNKTPLGSYRGWGQPQANFAVERTIDKLARELGIDGIELRRRNFIPPDAFPYQSLHHVFDSGRYAEALDKALERFDIEGWRRRQRELRQQGRYVGLGVSCYIENTALGPSRILNAGGVEQGGYDIARVRIEPGGEVTVYTGLCEMGQGFTNGLAQVCADYLGAHPDQITVVTGDTSSCPYTGYGTGASRSASVGGAALMKASAKLGEKVRRIAGHMLEAAAEDLVLEDGEVWVAGFPARRVSFAEIGRAAYLRADQLPEGEDPGLEEIGVFDPPQMAWPYGVNCVAVEVDPDTGEVRFLDYAYVHDSGTVLNPMIVEGQIHGGVAQGIGSALFEELRYDESGQPLFGSFMDYVLPTAMEIPRIRIDEQVTPSPIIPGGTKGVGEAGAIGSPAAVVAAVEDALSPFGVRIRETPVTPERILRLLSAARGAAATVGSAA